MTDGNAPVLRPYPGSGPLRQLEDLKLAAENFRRAMLQSGAVSRVHQFEYIDQLRALECALNPLNYRDELAQSGCGAHAQNPSNPSRNVPGNENGKMLPEHGHNFSGIKEQTETPAQAGKVLDPWANAIDPDAQTPGDELGPSELIRIELRQAMLDCWNSICSDTDCHPLDIKHQGKKLFFTPDHWADMVAWELSCRLSHHASMRDLISSGGLPEGSPPEHRWTIEDMENAERNARLQRERDAARASSSQAKEPEASGGLCTDVPHAVLVGEASADLPATSERMDVTAGETAPNSPVAWVVFAENGNVRLWSPDRAGPQAFADAKGLICEPVFRRTAQCSRGLADIAAERRRQIDVEGWSQEHDDTHDKCEMATAAACYALAPSPVGIEREWSYPAAPSNWPWHYSWWKPRFYRENLIRAGALIVAEIERWDRLKARRRSSSVTSTDRGGK